MSQRKLLHTIINVLVSNEDMTCQQVLRWLALRLLVNCIHHKGPKFITFVQYLISTMEVDGSVLVKWDIYHFATNEDRGDELQALRICHIHLKELNSYSYDQE